MLKGFGRKSRKETPWDNAGELTATQKFLKEHYRMSYENHHTKVADSGETEMINSYVPSKCPFCGSEKFNKRGFTSSGI